MQKKKPSKSNTTPRPYLSHSQFVLFKSNPEEYRQRYFRGKTGMTSEAISLGKLFAEQMEMEKSDDEMVEMCRSHIAHYPSREHEIRASFKRIPLLAKLDGYNKEENAIGEFKTGRTRWTQEMVDKNTQLTFYALCAWLDTGKIPNDIKLYWFETEEQQGELCLTGKVKVFSTKRTISDFLKFYNELGKVWDGIIKMSEEEYSL